MAMTTNWAYLNQRVRLLRRRTHKATRPLEWYDASSAVFTTFMVRRAWVPLIILKFAGLATPSIHAGFRAKTNTIVM